MARSSKIGRADVDPGAILAEQRQPEAADGDHRAERDDDGADAKPFDQERVQKPDERARRRSPRRSRCSGWKSSVRTMPAIVAVRQHDGADGEVDAADQHDQRHAEAEDQDRRRLARRCSRHCPSVPKTGDVSAKARNSSDRREEHRVSGQDAMPRAAGRGAGAHAGRAAGTASRHRAPWTSRLSRSSSMSAGRVSATIAPSRTTRMRSASASTSGMSEDTTITALPAARQRVEPAVDLRARGDVDAARRLDQDEEVGIGEMPARDQRLLLVAARKRADRRRERARDDAEALA